MWFDLYEISRKEKSTDKENRLILSELQEEWIEVTKGESHGG